jgi:uncharacterized membrane protein HdeD (DUF308 family)
MEKALGRNWWVVAARGGLAGLFGLAILFWPRIWIGWVVVLFGGYALIDGVCAVVSAWRASDRPLEAWPVALEGLVSIFLGGLALVWPFVPPRLVHLIAWWGLATGVLEIITALRLPRALKSHWFFALGGISSIFLALLLFALHHADMAWVTSAIGVYALVFGLSLALGAFRLRTVSDIAR